MAKSLDILTEIGASGLPHRCNAAQSISGTDGTDRFFTFALPVSASELSTGFSVGRDLLSLRVYLVAL